MREAVRAFTVAAGAASALTGPGALALLRP